jgi:hypothetical protein
MFRLTHRGECSRRSTLTLAGALVLSAGAALVPSAHADEVAAFLEEQGLHQLLAAHLEQELMTANDQEKRSLVRRLASLYAMLLEQQTATEDRAGLEARAQLLLDQTDANEAIDLRLALAQATYRQIEQIAEQHRLRAARLEDVDRAAKMATTLAGQLEIMRTKLTSQLESSMRKLGRASGSESIVLAEQSEREERLANQCSYLLAWTLYYQAWLTESVKPAEAAESLFAELLGTESPKPGPEEVSVDLRSNEPVARAILGMALCRSLTRSSTTALQWIELLEHERTAAAVRDEAPAWRLAILLEHGEFDGVTQIIESFETGLDAAPAPWLRLIAAWSLEAGPTDADAIRLSRQAMTSLAARGALDHLIQLAERYGTEALGSSGFAPLYVQAVLGFQEVRQDHPGDKPAGDQGIQQRFAEVGARFERAVAQPDASQYSSAAANAALLAAWCMYFRSDFLRAADAFEKSAEMPALSDPSEALWMAVVCLDYLVAADENPTLDRRMSALVSRYLERYPAGKHVPELLLRRSYNEEASAPDMIAALLSVPPQSAAYLPSRQRAAMLLYKQFRAAPSEDRARTGREFLAVQQPVLTADLDSVLDAPSDGEAAQHLIIRCRQVLDAATTADVRDLSAATEAMDVLDRLKAAGLSLDDVSDEIEGRRVQIELMAGRVAQACALADALWNRRQESPWARLATRAVFRELLLDRQSADLADTDRETLELIARYGGRVIQEFAGNPETLARPETMTYQVIVAEASLELWRRTSDEVRGNAAIFLFEKLLERRPDDARFLRVTAELAAALGKTERALECWRTLLAGLEQGSDAWYEAKFHQVELLGRDDPMQALQVLKQHVHLEGGYGPHPWGEKLQELELALRSKAGRADGGGNE